ncbi:DoxX family protein [uncultured Bradyrhizobium sp.]|uniref:DoxX family protein n=1 Tax=Bradyrhizobium sp. TaxID=376 RepID=UPI002638F348|nr:DoxX family protein [uncultured Bradyrhizobium sp.]
MTERSTPCFDRSSSGRWAGLGLAALRIMSGLLFLEHGTQKLLGFPEPTRGIAPVLSLMGLAGCLEIFGGLSVVLGFQTRLVAFVLSGQMAIAYFLAHASRNFFPVLNGGDAAILFCFIFLFLALAGSGRLSVDSFMDGRKTSKAV